MTSPHSAPTTNDDLPRCLRCGLALPLDDDGFCDACRKALEEACL